MALLLIARLLLLLLCLHCVVCAKKNLAELKVDVIKPSEDCSGGVAATGDTVVAHYKGTLPATGQVFDTSRAKDREPFSFTLGTGKTIKGFDEGFLGMCVGEQRRLTIPPHLGYGDKGSPPIIPGGATLLFEVELISLEKKPFFTTASLTNLGGVLIPAVGIALVVYVIYERAKQEKAVKSKTTKGGSGKKRR